MSKIRLYLNYITFIISYIIPKKKNRWIFGAWYGNRISDNPYALFNYVRENCPNIDALWICNNVSDAEAMGIKAIKKNSWSAIWHCLTAEVAVMNQGYYDFGNLNWVKKSFKVQLWHGVPWKKIGEDTSDTKTGLLHRISHKTFLWANKYDLYIAPSEETRKVLKTAFLTDDNHILSVGQPRNEILMDSKRCSIIRDNLIKHIGNPEIIILYMPTFRDNSSDVFSFSQMDKAITSLLAKYNAVVLEKQHYVTNTKHSYVEKNNERIINVADFDTQELLATADILVTDYSSCFFDYIIRDKPVIHYVYDFDSYKNKDRGLYYNAEYVVAGSIIKTQEDLLLQIEKLLEGIIDESERRKLIRERFDTYESINNSRIIMDEIIKRTNNQ